MLWLLLLILVMMVMVADDVDSDGHVDVTDVVNPRRAKEHLVSRYVATLKEAGMI